MVGLADHAALASSLVPPYEGDNHEQTIRNRPRPPSSGAVPDANGVNFSVFSRNATSVELLLFDEHDDREPAQIVKLDAAVNKSFFFWHVYVKGLRPGAHYAYRVDGPADLHGQGFRFNPKA